MTDLERAKGVMFGLAVGDALGAPTEFLKLDQIRAKYGSDGIKGLHDPALFTDDTQMSIAIAEALVTAGDKDIELIMEAVREEFIKWSHLPETYKKAPGNTCLKGVANMEGGVHWTKSGILNSKGCGSAMRSAPVGYLYQHDPDKLKEVAHATGICTHGHPAGDAACIGAAYLVKLGLDGVSPEKMIAQLFTFTAGVSAEFNQIISKVEKCLGWEDLPSTDSPIPEFAASPVPSLLGEGWVGEEAVALALYCFLRNTDSYEKVVIRGANTNGDSDSIACIAGSISGACLGIDAIPPEWVKKIEKSEYLEALARRLAAKKEATNG